MSEEGLSFKGLRRTEFLKKLAQYETVTNRINELEKSCTELNRDIRDAFSVAGTSKEGDKTILHIVTSGEEGEEEARRILRELSDADDIDVKNKTAERYNEEEPFTVRRIFEECYKPMLSKSDEKKEGK